MDILSDRVYKFVSERRTEKLSFFEHETQVGLTTFGSYSDLLSDDLILKKSNNELNDITNSCKTIFL